MRRSKVFKILRKMYMTIMNQPHLKVDIEEFYTIITEYLYMKNPKLQFIDGRMRLCIDPHCDDPTEWFIFDIRNNYVVDNYGNGHSLSKDNLCFWLDEIITNTTLKDLLYSWLGFVLGSYNTFLCVSHDTMRKPKNRKWPVKRKFTEYFYCNHIPDIP